MASALRGSFALAAIVAAYAQVQPLNFSDLGPAFDGIGALSGGGGVTRLLVDYPTALQQDIFDVLFKPNAGASLQIIKVEIGGDTQSTEGTEQSHEHFRGDLNCSRGYEWWVVAEAKKRNPAIKTFGLSWGVPGWIGGGNYYSQDNINYHLDWISCAENTWNFTVDFMGIWNERDNGPENAWIKQLRAALDDAGYVNTRIVAKDTNWNVASDMASDPELAAAIDVVGAHYPSQPPPVAYTLNKTLWASEMWNLGQVDDWPGALGLSSDLMSHAHWGLSSSILWCLIYSWPALLPFSRTTNTNAGAGHSILTAAEPWSGHYELNPQIYAMAHHTQFAAPGWTYVAGSGQGTLSDGTQYTVRVNTHTPASTLEFSITLLTSGNAAAAAAFSITGIGLKSLPSVLHVWQTTEGAYFVQQPDVSVSADGHFSVPLASNAMLSVTTTSGQGRAAPANPIPPSAPFPFPYSDTFDSYPEGAYARYFCDEGGVFVVQSLPPNVGTGGSALTQIITQIPIAWETNPTPTTMIGNFNGAPGVTSWTDYTATVSAAISLAPPTPQVVVVQPCAAGSSTQLWAPVGQGLPAQIASVSDPSMCLGLGNTDPGWDAPSVALLPCNSSSAPVWSMVPATSQLTTGGGLCADVLGDKVFPGDHIIAFPCKSPSDPTLQNEQWRINSNKTISSYLPGGFCMDSSSSSSGEPSSFVFVSMRINTYIRNGAPSNGYALYVFASANATAAGTWSLQFGGNVLKSGSTPSPILPGVFHTLAVQAAGSRITAFLDNVTLATLTDTSSSYGMAAVGSGWHVAYFKNFAVTNNTAL